MLDSINSLFQRDLDKLEKEISSYVNEADLWVVKGEILNSAGNLALHICGNLQHFIGATLGGNGYLRNREHEFNATAIPINDLIKEIDVTKKVINQVLTSFKQDDLIKDFPIEVFGHPMTTEYFVLHLLAHLNYHLGQVNYHRRLV